MNACPIVVYIVDEESLLTKAIRLCLGNLGGSAESGEERFTVEWNRDHDSVWYDILAFSRPKKMLTRLGYPLSRLLQERFAKGSKAALVDAVNRQ